MSLTAAYPNPVNSSLSVDLGSPNTNSVAMYDMNGKMVYNNKNVSGLEELIIDVDHLERRMFSLVFTNSDIVKTLKVVKQ